MVEKNFYMFPPITDREFPIYIELQHYHSPGDIFPTHWHEHVEFLFMMEGELTLTCNGNIIEGKKEDLLIINANEIHHLRTNADYVYYYCIVFDTSFIKSSLIDRSDLDYIIPLANNHIVFKNKISHHSQINACLKSLIQEYEAKEPAYELAVKSSLYHLMTLLIRNGIDTVLSDSTYQKRRCSLNIIQQILVYLHDHYAQDINLPELAGHFNISYYYLCHLFKKYTGTTILHYANSVRINKAVELLEHTDKSITEIATLVGYNDINYFSRIFKREMKYCPSKSNRHAPVRA